MLIFFSLEIGPQGPYNLVGESQRLRTLWFQEMELVIKGEMEERQECVFWELGGEG